MVMSSPGPLRIRINPFLSSSSSLSSKVEGWAGTGLRAGTFLGSGGSWEVPMLAHSLWRSWVPHPQRRTGSISPRRASSPCHSLTWQCQPCSPAQVLPCHPAPSPCPPPLLSLPSPTSGLGPSLTRSRSRSFRVLLSCFSSSAILAMDSFSASRSRSVSYGTSTW
uniref:Uncharacterized protein n=1 Tax=Sarcophilus harrisii TaxID=9305 RepID=A0A7N4NQY5_SARHA